MKTSIDPLASSSLQGLTTANVPVNDTVLSAFAIGTAENDRTKLRNIKLTLFLVIFNLLRIDLGR